MRAAGQLYADPERCWFAIWEGYAELPGLRDLDFPWLRMNHRDILVLTGPLSALPNTSFRDLWYSHGWDNPAAQVIVPGGTYEGNTLKGASFVIGSGGTRARFHGRASVGLLCGPKKVTGSPSTGQYAAVIVLDASSAPTLKINNATGTFRGSRGHNDATVTIVGKFSADAGKMMFTVKTSGMCSSSKYTFHST